MKRAKKRTTHAWVSEYYTTIQGTGVHAGELQFFVRFAGCSVLSCPIRGICDQPESLERGHAAKVEIESLVKMGAAESKWIHLTGGEPLDQPKAVFELLEWADQAGTRVHIHTSGTRKLPCECHFLSISPKCRAADLAQWSADEVIIVYDPKTMSMEYLMEYHEKCNADYFWLQPAWDDSGAENPRRYRDVFEMVQRLFKEGRQRWRVGSQLHKHMGLK